MPEHPEGLDPDGHRSVLDRGRAAAGGLCMLLVGLCAMVLGPIVLRLAVLVAGVGIVAAFVLTDQPLPQMMFGVAFGGLFLLLFAGIVITDIRRRRWRGWPGRDPNPSPPTADPAGAPTATEWMVAVALNGFATTAIVAGVLDLVDGGDGALLVTGIVCTAAVLVPTCGTIGRWLDHRR